MYLLFGLTHACQVGHDLHSGGPFGLKGDLLGKGPRRATGPVGYRHKIRSVRLQPVQGLQHCRYPLGGPGRKEFEGDRARFLQDVFDLQAGYPITAGGTYPPAERDLVRA